MSFPEPPDGIRAAEPADFVPGPAAWAWGRITLIGLVFTCAVAWIAVLWGATGISVTLTMIAGLGWLAALVAQWVNLRRDQPVVLTLADVKLETTERGEILVGEFAEPVPARLRKMDLPDSWRRDAAPGERVAARLRETGFGLLTITLGTPTVDGWRLPPPRPVWPVTAQLCVLWTYTTVLLLVIFGLAPSTHVVGQIVDVEPLGDWAAGTGQVSWRVVVEPADEWMMQRSFIVPHAQLLELLDPAGQRAFAAPGYLSGADRDRLWAQAQPIGVTVRLRATALGPWQVRLFEGKAP